MFCILSHRENDSVRKVTQLDAFQSVEVPMSFACLYLDFRRQLKFACKSHTRITTKVCSVFVQCNFITYAIFLCFANCFMNLFGHIFSDNFKQICLNFIKRDEECTRALISNIWTQQMHENIGHEMTTSKFLRNEEGCNNGHGTLSNAYHCTFHSAKHLRTNATDEKHDQYRLIGTLLRSVLMDNDKFACTSGC